LSVVKSQAQSTEKNSSCFIHETLCKDLVKEEAVAAEDVAAAEVPLILDNVTFLRRRPWWL
jgi:hypothetical protein